jgi:hypothetical protein
MPPPDERRPEDPGSAPRPPHPPESHPPGTSRAGAAHPPGTRSRARPRAAAGRAAQQQATAALFLALLSLAGLLAIGNLTRGAVVAAFGLLASAAAGWYAAAALRQARRQGTALPHGCVAALIIAGASMTISVILLAGFAVFGKQVSAYSHCLSGANTLSAQHACSRDFAHSLSGVVSHLRQASRG